MNDAVWSPNHPHFGCLPRKSRPGELCPMAADRIEVIPEDQWDALAAQITLQPHVKAVLNQDSAGSCATESSTGGTMVGRALAGLPYVLLNPWFIYWHTGGSSDRGDGRSGGSSIDENLAFIREKGIAPESVWPRSKGWGYRGANRPSVEAYAAALDYRIVEFYDISNVAEMVSALLKGFPVVFGSDGHSILAVAHKGTYPLILNSWGNWGEGGFGKWCSYSGINWSYGAFCIRVTSE